jgi:hypothetical protein
MQCQGAGSPNGGRLRCSKIAVGGIPLVADVSFILHRALSTIAARRSFVG